MENRQQSFNLVTPVAIIRDGKIPPVVQVQCPNCGQVTSIPLKHSDGPTIDYEGRCTGRLLSPVGFCNTSLLITPQFLRKWEMTLRGKRVQVVRPTPRRGSPLEFGSTGGLQPGSVRVFGLGRPDERRPGLNRVYTAQRGPNGRG